MTTTDQTASELPDQPDGIDENSYALPSPQRAAERISEYLSSWGDGLIDVAGGNGLYARDLEAVAQAVLKIGGPR